MFEDEEKNDAEQPFEDPKDEESTEDLIDAGPEAEPGDEPQPVVPTDVKAEPPDVLEADEHPFKSEAPEAEVEEEPTLEDAEEVGPASAEDWVTVNMPKSSASEPDEPAEPAAPVDPEAEEMPPVPVSEVEPTREEDEGWSATLPGSGTAGIPDPDAKTAPQPIPVQASARPEEFSEYPESFTPPNEVPLGAAGNSLGFVGNFLSSLGIADPQSQKWVAIGGAVLIFLCCSCACVIPVISMVFSGTNAF